LQANPCCARPTPCITADTQDGKREALALVLDIARWFTIACGTAYARHFEAAYRQRASELGTDVVPFADWWVLETDAIFRERPPFLEPVVRELGQRWTRLLELPPDAQRVQLRAADLRERVTAAFPAGPLPWPMAVHHLPRPDDRRRQHRHRRPAHLGGRRGPPGRHELALCHLADVP
jgi:hypothetical protein